MAQILPDLVKDTNLQISQKSANPTKDKHSI